MEKSAIFIDGGYLQKVQRKLGGVKPIDFLKLCKKIEDKTGLQRLRTYYYNCKPLHGSNPNTETKRRVTEADKFYQKLLRLPRFEVKFGRLQCIKGIYKQKMVDVIMSLDIVNMCFDNQIQHAIIVGGDSDFVPAIEIAKNYGAIVHLFHHCETVHHQILDTVDEIHELDKDFFSDLFIK